MPDGKPLGAVPCAAPVLPDLVKGDFYMSMQAGGGSGGLQSEINVTPMVDIMLVLLIIFMVVTPFLQQGITVALPKNLNNPDVDPNIIKESSIVISIPNDGEYYLGKIRMGQDQVAEKV